MGNRDREGGRGKREVEGVGEENGKVASYV